MTAALSVRALVKHYGALRVTDGVDLDIEEGQTLAIIGPNGAGKTTLINQITGQVPSDSGQILVQGRDVTNWPIEARARLGLGRSYQITSIIGSLTVLENALLAVQAARGHNFYFFKRALAHSGLVKRAEHFLSIVGLADSLCKPASHLSYGQQRQLELAMTLAIEPKVLLLDEPMAGLGAVETQQMVGVLKSIEGRYAMLLVEHDMHAVFALAHRLSVLVYGKVVFTGTADEVRQSAVVREAYLGDEEIPA